MKDIGYVDRCDQKKKYSQQFEIAGILGTSRTMS